MSTNSSTKPGDGKQGGDSKTSTRSSQNKSSSKGKSTQHQAAGKGAVIRPKQ